MAIRDLGAPSRLASAGRPTTRCAEQQHRRLDQHIGVALELVLKRRLASIEQRKRTGKPPTGRGCVAAPAQPAWASVGDPNRAPPMPTGWRFRPGARPPGEGHSAEHGRGCRALADREGAGFSIMAWLGAGAPFAATGPSPPQGQQSRPSPWSVDSREIHQLTGAPRRLRRTRGSGCAPMQQGDRKGAWSNQPSTAPSTVAEAGHPTWTNLTPARAGLLEQV